MPVITISRQLGSLGSAIAREVSTQLGYRLVWHNLINESALRAGAPVTALAMIDELGLLGISPTKKEIRSFRKALQQVIEELYSEDNVVIVGRAGQFILRNKPGTLHVRIIAPAVLRAERLTVYNQIPLEKAIAQIEASDTNRRKFLKRLFKIDWRDPLLYDLMINTVHLNTVQAVRLIIESVPTAVS